MAVYVAQEAFHFFGVDYAGGATIDTTGWPQHQVDQLVEKHPVELQGTAGAQGAQGPTGAAAPLTENVNTIAASGAAQTLPDVTTATMHNVMLTVNTTLTLPTPGAGKSFTARLAQDATGGRTVAWATPSGAIRWAGGAAPAITATANAVDVVTFACVDGVNWLGFVAGQAFA